MGNHAMKGPIRTKGRRLPGIGLPDPRSDHLFHFPEDAKAEARERERAELRAKGWGA